MSSKPLVQYFVDDLVDVIDKYRDQGLTISETIGAIELIKIDIINDSIEEGE